MGEQNNTLRVYLNHPDRIRSILEYCLGEKLPEDWSCCKADGFLTVRNRKGKLTFRERDYLGNAKAWGVCFLLGIENQETFNLTYPWRLMEMDCLTYGNEIQKIQEKNGANEVKYGDDDDFKYRYRKGDRLKPVVNLMLYWGRKPWTGPSSLQEMMTEERSSLPEKFRQMIGDYRVYMVPMRFISDADLQKMDSDLKYVLGIMKCTSSAKSYRQFILENREYFSRIPRSAADVIDVFTNIKDVTSQLQYTLNEENGEEEADMCKAWEDIKRQEKEKGIRQGIQQGMKEGIQQGIQQGVKQGVRQGVRQGVKQGVKQGIQQGIQQGVKQGERTGTLKTLYSLVSDGLLKLEDAAVRADLSQETFRRKMRKAGYR